MPSLVSRRKDRDGASQEGATRVVVAAIERGAATTAQMTRSPAGEIGQDGIAWVELGPVAMCLLEVIADDLVALDEVVLREPVGESLVELRTRRLGQRLVGGIPDEEVTKAESLVLGKGRFGCTDQLLPHQRRQMRPDGRPDGIGRKLCDGASMEHLSFHRSALHHVTNIAVERVDARLEERVDGGRHDDLPVAAVLAHHREHLLDEERVAG